MLKQKIAGLLVVAGSLGLSQAALADTDNAFGPDPWYVTNERVADPKPSNDGGIAKPFGADVWYVYSEVDAKDQMAGDVDTSKILLEAFGRQAGA